MSWDPLVTVCNRVLLALRDSGYYVSVRSGLDSLQRRMWQWRLPKIGLVILVLIRRYVCGSDIDVSVRSDCPSLARRLTGRIVPSRSPRLMRNRICFLSLVALLLDLALRNLLLRRGTRVGFARHRNVASSDVREENGVVDADGEKDPSRILLLTENVRVDEDQEKSDTDEAGDVAEHLSFPLPGQLEVY